MLRATLLVGAAGLLLAACATGERLRLVRAGHTRAQVEQLLGGPDSYQRAGNVELLSYLNRGVGNYLYDRADYHVILTGGYVTAYGPGPVRVQATSAEPFVLAAVR